MKIHYIPLGTRCSSAFIIRDNLKKREMALPFDWLDMPISAISQFVRLQSSEVVDYVDEYFSSVGTISHRYEDSELFAYNRHPDGTWFAHDIELKEGAYRLKPGTKEKFAKRLKRLIEMFDDKNVFFVFLTVMYEIGMYDIKDYDVVKNILKARIGEKSVFITVNLDSEPDFQKENHFNFNIPQLNKFDDGLKEWEALINNRIIHDEHIQQYIK